MTSALPSARDDSAEGVGDELQPDAVRALPTPPTPDDLREQIRRTIKAALANGDASLEDVVADMYASIYATEISLKKMFAFMEHLSGSPLFSRILGGGKRSKKGMSLPGMGEIDMNAMAAEVEKSLTIVSGGKADGTVES